MPSVAGPCPLHQPRCRRRNERSMRPTASESNPANPIAGSGLAVFGSVYEALRVAAAGAGAAGCRCAACAAGVGRGLLAAPAAGAGAGAAAGFGGSDRHQLERRHVEFTKVVRVLAGFPLESAADLHPAAEHRIVHAGFARVIERQGIGTGVGRARCLWYAGNGPFSRARQRVLVLLSAAHRTATNQTSHRGNLPALFLRQQAPIPSLRVCGSDRHHTESEDHDRCTIDILKCHRRPPVAVLATTDPLVTPANIPCCRSAQTTGAA